MAVMQFESSRSIQEGKAPRWFSRSDIVSCRESRLGEVCMPLSDVEGVNDRGDVNVYGCCSWTVGGDLIEGRKLSADRLAGERGSGSSGIVIQNFEFGLGGGFDFVVTSDVTSEALSPVISLREYSL